MTEPTSEDSGPISAAVTVNEQGRFLAVSAAFLELIERSVGALTGINLIDLLHPLDAEPARRMLAATAAGSSPEPIEARVFVADDRWLSLRLTVADNNAGRVTLHLGGVAIAPAAAPTGALVAAPDGSAVEQEAAMVEPQLPGDIDDAFPYEDSPEHLAYVATLPVAEVAEQRATIRTGVGTSSTPMLEIDGDGRTVFVGGTWAVLSTDGNTRADVFEELLEKSDCVDAILQAIDDACTSGRASRHELGVAGVPPRWVQVVSLPSPHFAGVMHALVSVVAESERCDFGALPLPPGPTDSGQATSVSQHTPPASSRGAQLSADTTPPSASVLFAAQRDPSMLGDPGARAQPQHNIAAVDAATTAADPGLADDAPAERAATAAAQAPPATHATSSFRWPRPWENLLTTGDQSATAVEMLDPSGTRANVLWGVVAVTIYVAVQGLYLGPAYGWRSPIQGILDSQQCLVQPLCDNNVLPFNHLAVLALLASVAAFAALFTMVGPRRLDTVRATVPSELSQEGHRPGVFLWLSTIAVGVVTVQTVFADEVSTLAWVAATVFGAVAAWRTDRDVGVALDSTMSALAVAVACLLVPLGVGGIWVGEHRLVGLCLLIAGVAMFVYSLVLLRVAESSSDSLDYALMLGLSLTALVLGLLRHHTWRYAFIGDEWSFFEGAMDDLHGKSGLGTFDIGGPNNYFTGLTYELQASGMRLGGADVWGWRLSSLLPMVLSVAAMYAFTRWLAGRTAAIAAAIALATGHMLLSFSMVPYNNSQSLVAVSASFAALAWAHQRPSALRFFLLGSALGSTFLVYAMARLALLPIGVLFVVLFRDSARAFVRRVGWVSLGGLAMAAPALFSWQNWDALLKATPVQAEDSVLEAGSVGRQMLENTFAGWLSFIGSTRNTLYIVGPHLDLISAVLLIVGLGFVIARVRTDKALLAFLVGGIGLWTAINAIQQYAQISNTRSFMVPLVYCVFIGIGVSALLPMITARIPSDLSRFPTMLVALAGFALLLTGVNQWHIGGYANNRQQLTEQALLVQQFERTESVDGLGMRIHVGWSEERNERLTMVLRAHDVAPERIVIVPDDGTLNMPQLCATAEPTMVAMHRSHPMAEEWTSTLARCWETTVVAVTDPSGALKLLRVANAAGVAEFDKAPGQRFAQDAETEDFSLADTIDIATDGAGVGFALVRSDSGGMIQRLDGGGSFDLVQNQPVDFDVTNDGLFVVAANGGDDRIVWYDGKGNVVQRYPGQSDFPTIGGLTVDGDRLWVSDTTGARVIAFDADFEIDEIRVGQGALLEPASLTIGPDDALWVFSAGSGEIVLVDADDNVSLRLPAQVFNPVDGPRLASTQLGWLIRTIPERPVVELVNPLGEVVDSRGGATRPRAAASRIGELIVADPRWNDVQVVAIDDRWSPSPRGAIDWGVRSISADVLAVYDSPFIIDELREPGPISTELTETEAVIVADGQVWRSIGAVVIGELHAVAATDDGAYVADVNGRLIRLDTDGAAMNVVGLGGGGASFVSDLAIDGSGVVWALDAGLGRLVSIEPDGTVTAVDTDPATLVNARGLGMGLDDTVWVASTSSAQLTNIDASGRVVAALPLPGRQPSDVAQLPDGTLWIVDAQEIELVHLTEQGADVTAVALDPFSSVQSPHLALRCATLWVTEPEMSAVFAIDTDTDEPTGERVDLLRPDEARIDKPIGISVGPDARLWITDSLGAAVIILDP